LKIGLLTRDPDAWCSTQLRRAIRERGQEPVVFGFTDVVARVGSEPKVTAWKREGGIDLVAEVPAVIVRPIGRGSLDETIFRLDMLHRLERLGVRIFNPPSAIEKAVDKYYALTLLEEGRIPVPRTIVVESAHRALDAFQELGGDVVVKPVFGSRGIGITRVSDPEIAQRIFRSLDFIHHVLYLQEFVRHGRRDIRAFVVGDRVIAAMRRVGRGWKTNVSQGAKPVALKPDPDLERLVISAAKTIGCEIAGVDVMEGPDGRIVNEINSQPGFRGLQSVTETDIAGQMVDYVVARVKGA
jgi:RimK family alpha-L-glutamate ligase